MRGCGHGRDWLPFWKESSRFWKICGGMAAAILGLGLLTALAPPIKYDALMYHLTMPQAYLRTWKFFLPALDRDDRDAPGDRNALYAGDVTGWGAGSCGAGLVLLHFSLYWGWRDLLAPGWIIPRVGLHLSAFWRDSLSRSPQPGRMWTGWDYSSVCAPLSAWMNGGYLVNGGCFFCRAFCGVCFLHQIHWRIIIHSAFRGFFLELHSAKRKIFSATCLFWLVGRSWLPFPGWRGTG